jgi:hypothetical protein
MLFVKKYRELCGAFVGDWILKFTVNGVHPLPPICARATNGNSAQNKNPGRINFIGGGMTQVYLSEQIPPFARKNQSDECSSSQRTKRPSRAIRLRGLPPTRDVFFGVVKSDWLGEIFVTTQSNARLEARKGFARGKLDGRKGWACMSVKRSGRS